VRWGLAGGSSVEQWRRGTRRRGDDELQRRLVARPTQAAMAGAQGRCRWRLHGAVLPLSDMRLVHSSHATYPAYNAPTTLAVTHHVAGASAHSPARELTPQAGAQLGGDVVVFIAAVQRVSDELAAVLEQIGAELAARARQIVERVQVELAGKLADDTAPFCGQHASGREVVPARFRLTDNSSARLKILKYWDLASLLLPARCPRSLLARENGAPASHGGSLARAGHVERVVHHPDQL
jgi:hypothetical protein